MKTFRKFFIVIFLLSATVIRAELSHMPDTLIRPDRDQLGVQLIQLRDSMDATLKTIEKNSGKNAQIVNQQLDKHFKDLKASRVEVDRAIGRVAVTNADEWNVDIQNDLINILNDKRNEYRRILENVRQVFIARNFRS